MRLDVLLQQVRLPGGRGTPTPPPRPGSGWPGAVAARRPPRARTSARPRQRADERGERHGHRHRRQRRRPPATRRARSTAVDRRARRRRPPPAGTGRPAGCGTRPGSSRRPGRASRRRAARAPTRGSRSSVTMAISAFDSPLSRSYARDQVEQLGGDRPGRADRPERAGDRDQHGRPTRPRPRRRRIADQRRTQPRADPPLGTPAGPDGPGRARPGRRRSSSGPQAGTLAMASMIALQQVDDARAPAGRDVVVEGDDLAVLHRGDAGPAGRCPTVVGDCPQHLVSARKIRSGLALTMISGGQLRVAAVSCRRRRTASAMLSRPPCANSEPMNVLMSPSTTSGPARSSSQLGGPLRQRPWSACRCRPASAGRRRPPRPGGRSARRGR